MSVTLPEPSEPTAEVVVFPREGYVIGGHLCAVPGPKGHELCFAERGHEGDHVWGDWRGCRVRVPFGGGTVPFGGFAY